MKLGEIGTLLGAKVLCGEDKLGEDILCACGSDMMSEVLAFTKYKAVLLTGLCNNHVLRTAEMLDITSIIFVRGKMPTQELIDMAEDMGIVLMTSPLPMFSACGILYQHVIKGGMRKE